MGGTARTRDDRWGALFGVVFASTVAALNLYKVPPLIPVLTTQLGISAGDAGSLVSIYALAGLLVSVPTAWLLRRLGPRHALAVGSGLTAFGSVAGALSAGFWPLLASRFVEGAGLGVVIVVAVVEVAAVFPPARRGLPIGIFSVWLPLGSLLALYLAPAVEARAGWQAVWWAAAAVALLAVVVGELVVPGRRPERAAHRPGETVASRLPRLGQLVGSPALPLAVAFSLFHISRSAFLTWAPTYLVMRGLGLADAAALAGLSTVLTIPLCVVAGGLIAFMGSPQSIYSVGMLVSAPLFVVAFFVEPSVAAPLLLAIGAIAALVPTAVNLVAPDARPRGGSPGVAVATVSFGRNAGMLLGPWLAGATLQVSGYNWALVGWGIGAASVVGGLLGLFGPVSTGAHEPSTLEVAEL